MRNEMVIELVAKEKTYVSKEIAEALGVGATTLRKWCGLLEQRGYGFQRDAHERRIYRQHDLVLLRRLKELSQTKGLPLEMAVTTTISEQKQKQQRRSEPKSTAPVPLLKRNAPLMDPLEQKVDMLATQVQNQEVINQILLDRLDKQEQYIRTSLKERDRNLMQAMNDILEAKVFIAAAKAKEEKKTIWHRLFRIE